MEALPLTEVLLPPLSAIAFATVVPFLTARALAWVYLGDLPREAEARARRLVPFRRAALVVGVAQVFVAWELGLGRLGPTLVSERFGPASFAFGALVAAIAFIAGGVARRVEEREGERSRALDAALLRARMVPFAAGPVIAVLVAMSLRLTRAGAVDWPMVGLALAICLLGVAYVGLAASIATGALRPASKEVRALAVRAAEREGAPRPLLVLHLSTGTARFVNAAAIPWARTVVVTESAERLLEKDELDAVLAHEAAHLSEGPEVMLGRLSAAAILAFTLGPGLALATALPGRASSSLVAFLVLAAGFALVSVRKLARRMEERADRRAVEHGLALPLASALRKLHAYAMRPMTAGGRRVHPDLWDRLRALGEDPGERPAPIPRRGGTALGLGMALVVAGPVMAATVLLDMDASEVRGATPDEARMRLRLDPWDAEAMLALAWRAREAGDVELAKERATVAARMGPDGEQYYLAWAEIHAASGDCESARDAFARALEAQAERTFASGGALRLGDYTLPPTLVTGCELTVGDAFGEDAVDDDGNVRVGWEGAL